MGGELHPKHEPEPQENSPRVAHGCACHLKLGNPAEAGCAATLLPLRIEVKEGGGGCHIAADQPECCRLAHSLFATSISWAYYVPGRCQAEMAEWAHPEEDNEAISYTSLSRPDGAFGIQEPLQDSALEVPAPKAVKGGSEAV